MSLFKKSDDVSMAKVNGWVWARLTDRDPQTGLPVEIVFQLKDDTNFLTALHKYPTVTIYNPMRRKLTIEQDSSGGNMANVGYESYSISNDTGKFYTLRTNLIEAVADFRAAPDFIKVLAEFNNYHLGIKKAKSQ